MGERTEASREIEEAKEEIFSQRLFSKSKAQSLNFYFKFLVLREKQEAHFLICLSRMSPFSWPLPPCFLSHQEKLEFRRESRGGIELELDMRLGVLERNYRIYPIFSS